MINRNNDILAIIGANGHGKVVADIAIKMKKWKGIIFIDDDSSIQEVMGIKVVGTTNDILKYKDKADFIVAIGDNEIRMRLIHYLETKKISLVNVIHPSAIIGTDVKIDYGTVVMAGVIISNSSVIGSGCILNTNCTIDHDCIIGDYVHISPGVNIAGSVTVGDRNWIGIGSVVINNITICKGCIIGAGAVVIKNIDENGTYIGVPAKKKI